MSRAFRGTVLAALLVALNAGVVIQALGPLHRPKQVLETDHRTYIEMSWSLPWQAEVDPPYCWRLVAPLAVSRLVAAGVDMNLAWYSLTNVCLVGFLALLHAWLGRLGFSERDAALGVVLAGLLPGAVRWYEYQYWMSDPPALLLVAAGFLLVGAGRDGALGALGVVATGVRETWLLLLPFQVASAVRRVGPRRAWRPLALAWLPVLTTLIVVRYVWLPHPGEDTLATLREMLGFRWRHLFDNQLYFASVGSFGVLVPLILLRPGRLPGMIRRHPGAAGVVAVAYASLAVANNTDRLLAYAVPVVVPAGLVALRHAREATGWGAGLDAGVLAVQAVLWATTPFHGVLGLSIYQPTNPVALAACAGLWLAVRIASRNGARPAPAA